MYPEKFDKYRVEKALGPGGAYGITFLVWGDADEPLALKWLKPDAPKEGRLRFQNEVWALKKLDHPSLPKFVDEGEAEGRHGFRLDADYALLSLLRERFALFMKVYTHQTKVAAGAMLGKALLASGLTESAIEDCGDDELLRKLRESTAPVASRIADKLLQRRLYKPVYRARALDKDERSTESYRERQTTMNTLGLLTPAGRAAVERSLASEAGIDEENIVVYAAASAPGAQKVQQYVEVSRGRPRMRDELHKPYQQVFRDHLSLWNIYVFVDPEIETAKKLTVAENAEERFSRDNEIQVDRRQLVFDF